MLALTVTTPPRNAVVVATTPGLQADAAGLCRGATILTVDGVDLVNDATQAGVDTLNAGLFPTTAGSHTLGVLDPGATTLRTVTLAASRVTETPVPQARTLPAPNQSVGYLEFDSHIATARPTSRSSSARPTRSASVTTPTDSRRAASLPTTTATRSATPRKRCWRSR